MMGYLRNNKGIALVFCYLLIVILGLLGATYCHYAINEKNLTQRSVYLSQAFYLAESGIDRALIELRKNYDWSTGFTDQPLADVGTFSVNVTSDGDRRRLVSTGKAKVSASSTINYRLEAYAEKQNIVPEKFFNYDIYGIKKVKLCNVTVNGDVIYGDKINSRKGTVINGTQTEDSTISPLILLDFASLKDKSQEQGNYYDKDRLEDVKKGRDSFPDSFWYDEPNQVPNVVYVESDLHIKGDFGTIGGFFVVAGHVLSKEGDTGDAHIDGKGTIEGSIYTTGKLHIHAKGHEDLPGDDEAEFDLITIHGNVWAGKDTHIHKSTELTYKLDYINAIKNLALISKVQVITWRPLELE